MGSKLRRYGAAGLVNTDTNNSYRVKLKVAAVEAYLQGQVSMIEICQQFSIRSKSQLIAWTKMYNCHRDFRVTEGLGRGIYMTKQRLSTRIWRLLC